MDEPSQVKQLLFHDFPVPLNAHRADLSSKRPLEARKRQRQTGKTGTGPVVVPLPMGGMVAGLPGHTRLPCNIRSASNRKRGAHLAVMLVCMVTSCLRAIWDIPELGQGLRKPLAVMSSMLMAGPSVVGMDQARSNPLE